VCKEVFIRHLSLSLPFRTHSGYKSGECQEYGENHFDVRILGKPLQLPDSLNGMKEITLESHPLCVSRMEKTFFILVAFINMN
jgi:hypothetical protein